MGIEAAGNLLTLTLLPQEESEPAELPVGTRGYPAAICPA